MLNHTFFRVFVMNILSQQRLHQIWSVLLESMRILITWGLARLTRASSVQITSLALLHWNHTRAQREKKQCTSLVKCAEATWRWTTMRYSIITSMHTLTHTRAHTHTHTHTHACMTHMTHTNTHAHTHTLVHIIETHFDILARLSKCNNGVYFVIGVRSCFEVSY